MRCQYCRRPLIASAVPGLKVGPKCAKDRGLLPGRPEARVRLFNLGHARHFPDPRQFDWINHQTPAEPEKAIA